MMYYIQDIDLCTKTKLISIATCIFNNFGNSTDVESLIVSNIDDDESQLVY